MSLKTVQSIHAIKRLLYLGFKDGLHVHKPFLAFFIRSNNATRINQLTRSGSIFLQVEGEFTQYEKNVSMYENNVSKYFRNTSQQMLW